MKKQGFLGAEWLKSSADAVSPNDETGWTKYFLSIPFCFDAVILSVLYLSEGFTDFSLYFIAKLSVVEKKLLDSFTSLCKLPISIAEP